MEPFDIRDLLRLFAVPGIGPVKVERYGADVLRVIAATDRARSAGDTAATEAAS